MPMLHVGEEGMKEQADQILNDFIDACLELDLRYCLIAGTALGFYRDGGYVENDNDIDVWVDIEKADWTFEVWAETVKVEALRTFQVSGSPPHLRGEVFIVPTELSKKLMEQGMVWEVHGNPPPTQYPAPTDKKFIALIRRLKNLGFRHCPNFHHFDRGNMLLDILGGDRLPHRYDPAHYEQFDTVTYNDREYNVPHPIEDYLRMRYGSTWKTRRIRPPR